MSRYVVHIGPHKTGTTTIQQYLSDNRDRLLEQGVDFPKIGRIERGAQAHRYFSAFMRDQRHEYPDNFLLEASDWRPSADTVILSSEDFWFGSVSENIIRLLELIGRIDRAVVFLRDPVDHLISHYRESIKSGSSQSIVDFAAVHTRHLLQSQSGFSYYRYTENISRWQLVGEVREVVYQNKMDLLSEFFAAAGINSLDRTLMQPVINKNIANSDTISALLLLINKLSACGKINKENQHLLKKRLGKASNERKLVMP